MDRWSTLCFFLPGSAGPQSFFLAPADGHLARDPVAALLFPAGQVLLGVPDLLLDLRPNPLEDPLGLLPALFENRPLLPTRLVPGPGPGLLGQLTEFLFVGQRRSPVVVRGALLRGPSGDLGAHRKVLHHDLAHRAVARKGRLTVR
jgi:hypothetical protein